MRRREGPALRLGAWGREGDGGGEIAPDGGVVDRGGEEVGAEEEAQGLGAVVVGGGVGWVGGD